MTTLERFLARCGEYRERRSISSSYLSRLLFNDGKRLRQLAEGNTDIGILRLEAAARTLAALERQLDLPVRCSGGEAG